SPRPSSSSRRPLQTQAVLDSASPGLAPAPGGPCRPCSSPSRPPPAQLLPLLGLSSCQTSSGQPLQCPLLLPAASAGPRWPRLGLSRARSCSRRPLQAVLVAQSASAGPAPASPRPLQLPDLLRSASPVPAPPPGGLCRPTLASTRPLQGSLPLPAAPAGPTRRPVGLRRPSSCLSTPSPAAR
ncbi:hypothetical protein CP09DC78_1261B, partial [Chlamydia psittaci 09DC78]